MYIENEGQPESMTSPDNDVKEATAALKGMLGIGGGGVSPAAAFSTPVKEQSGKKPKKGKVKQSNNSTPKRTTKTLDNRNENSKSSGKNKKRENNKGQPKKENFAWSAFQASPDASALPIPAFISPGSSLRDTNELSKQLEPSQLSSLLSGVGQPTSMPPPIEVINAPRAEDLEAVQIAAAEKAKAAEAAPAPIATPQKAAPEQEKPVSESGINLAALAASPQPSSKPAPQKPPAPSSLPPTPFSSPAGQFASPGPHRIQHHPQSPYMSPSPGYVTIQVQVPPILGPDRQMVVPSPAGYPVGIVVPQGVPPGMVIPVHVPTGPMMPPQSPYGGGGYPHPQQQQHMHYQQQQQHQQQQFRQPQYHQQHPPSPHGAVPRQQQLHQQPPK